MRKESWFRLLALFLLLSLIAWATLNFRNDFNWAAIQTFIDGYGFWAPAAFMLLYIIATVLFLPGSALTITGGLIFGPLFGLLYNISAAVIGASLAFLISRYIAQDWVAQKTGGKLKELIEGVEKEGWRFVAVVRLVPLIPFNLLNYALGLTRIRLIEYVIASAIFMLPGTFAYTYLGSLGQAAIEGGGRELVGKTLFAIGLLVLVGLIPYFVKRYRKKKDDSYDN